jgi:hypothetical protein
MEIRKTGVVAEAEVTVTHNLHHIYRSSNLLRVFVIDNHDGADVTLNVQYKPGDGNQEQVVLSAGEEMLLATAELTVRTNEPGDTAHVHWWLLS